MGRLDGGTISQGMTDKQAPAVRERVEIADTLALILNQSGYRASTVYSGEQAVHAAAESSPHVLIQRCSDGRNQRHRGRSRHSANLPGVPRDSVLRPSWALEKERHKYA